MIKIVVIVAAILLQIAAAWSATSQTNSAKRFSVEKIDEQDGFIQNSVLDIKQDVLGYIWYATPNGVYRYDGYNFKIIYNEPENDASLFQNHVLSISSWYDDMLCFANHKVINIYNPQNEKITRINIAEKNEESHITDVEVDENKRGIIYVLNRGKVSILQLSDDLQSLQKVLVESVGDEQSYSEIICNDNGYIWLRSSGGVSCYKFDPENGVKQVFYTTINGILDAILGDDGKVVVSSKKQITTIAPSQNYSKFDVDKTMFGHEATNIEKIMYSPDNIIIGFDWSDGVLYKYNTQTKDISNFRIEVADDFNTKFRVNACLIDQSNVMWVGTRHGGLYKINLNEKPFLRFDDSLSDENPNQIAGDEHGNIYLGTHYNGIVHTNIFNSRKNNKTINKTLGIDTNEPIFALNFMGDYLYYANAQGSIYRAKCSSSGDVISHEEVAKVNGRLGFFFASKSGRLYYAVFAPNKNGKIYYCDNPQDGKPIFKELRDSNIETINIGGISSLHEDGTGVLWVGTSQNGLYRFELNENNLVEEITSINISDNIIKSNIFALTEDDSKNLYIGTFGGGLIVIDLNNWSDAAKYRYYSRLDGLSNNVIYSIVYAGGKELWISTDDGVSRFNTSDLTFRNFDMSDGIRSVNFRKWSSWISSNGYIFFGGTKGLNYFLPEQVSTNQYKPNTLITSFKVEGEQREYMPFLFKATSEEDNFNDINCYTLNSAENSFGFEFASLHFDNPEKNQYRYKLRGVDDNWQYTSSDARNVNYSNVPAGKYEFLVSGTNSDGVWSKEFSALRIEVLPHWSATWLARIIYLIILLILVRLFYLFAAQRQRHKMDNQLNQAKLDFFTNISHEIKTPLTIISGVLDINKEGEMVNATDIDIVRRNNSRMLALVTQLLDFKKVSEGHAPFKPCEGDIVPLMESISQSFALLASKSGIDYKFTNVIGSRNLVFEGDKIEKIISNLLSNAFKHTSSEGGEIELGVSWGVPQCVPPSIARNLSAPHESYTTISVRDNGEGIAPEHINNIFERFYQVGKYDLTLKHRGVGVGLAYSKLLAELHEGYIFVDSKQGEGSTFYLILPKKLKKTNAKESGQTTQLGKVEFLLDAKEPTAHNKVSDIIPQEKEVLIVEDNAEIRDFLRTIFAPLYTVREAENGKEGLQMAQSFVPDIIISDVMMPEMDGLTMCDHLKNDDKTNHIPLILLTANSTVEHRVEGLRKGADSYIAKPFNLEHLKVRVEKLLENRLLLKNKYMQLSGLADLADIDINAEDKEFLATIEKAIEERLDDPELTVEALEQILGYSHMQLYRKIKAISGVSVVEFIRNYRLKRSVDMMKEGKVRINEIMYAVGFSTPSYFSKSFKKRYDKTPVEFIEELKKHFS